MVRCWNGQLAPIRRSYGDAPVCPPIPESKQCSRSTVAGPDGLMHCPEDVKPYTTGKDQSETNLKTSPPPGCSGGNCDRNPHQDLSRPPEWAHRKIDPDLSPRGSWSYGVFVVYEGGSNDLYQESYLVAYLEDGHGNPACEGIVARIVNTSHKYPARVGLYGETSFVVRPQNMIELPLYQYRRKRDHRCTNPTIEVQWWREGSSVLFVEGTFASAVPILHILIEPRDRWRRQVDPGRRRARPRLPAEAGLPARHRRERRDADAQPNGGLHLLARLPRRRPHRLCRSRHADDHYDAER